MTLRNHRGRFQKGSQPNPRGKPRRDYDLTIIIEGKKRGLSGERISRKLKGIITGNRVNQIWRQEMAKTKKKGSGGGKRC